MSQQVMDKMARELCLLNKSSCDECEMAEFCLMRNCARCFYNLGYRKMNDIVSVDCEKHKQTLQELHTYIFCTRPQWKEMGFNFTERFFIDVENLLRTPQNDEVRE